MLGARIRPLSSACCAVLCAAFTQSVSAANLCVNPAGSGGCYSKIQIAVSHASANDVINVAAGTYKEDVNIGIPLSLIGAGAGKSVIDAALLHNGIYVDGVDNPGLRNVTIVGFTVENALWEGILLVSVSGVNVINNHIVNNDEAGPMFTGALEGCPGQPGFETDETGDCGGGLHLIGVANSIIADNVITGNADAILVTDETAESHDNLLIHNIASDNLLDCGVVFASHPPVGFKPPHIAAHYGVDHNIVMGNTVDHNGVQVQGAGMGMFSDGAGQGRVSGNLIINNTLTNNGIGGVSIHSHVGPAFGAPADDFSGNQIIGNFISGNLADTGDTATPGRVGININSGGGGSPIIGTVVSQNVISNEDVDIAVNTPGEVDIHLNDLLGGRTVVGVADVCAFDKATICTGSIHATQNYWGCPTGPGERCTTVSGADILFNTWLTQPITP